MIDPHRVSAGIVCGSERRRRLGRLRRFLAHPVLSIEHMVFSLISCHAVGGDSCPRSWHSGRFDPENGLRVPGGEWYEVICFLNDGWDVGLGWPDCWHRIYRARVFSAIVRWYVWTWFWSDWCGFRTKLWFWLLHRRVTRRKPRLSLRDDPQPDHGPRQGRWR